MTDTQYNVLMHLLRVGPAFSDTLYRVISPNGRFNWQRDPGSMGGGPSRTQYAGNNYMGKLARRGWVVKHYRDGVTMADGGVGWWVIAPGGVEALRGHWWGKQKGKNRLCQTCGGDFLPVSKSKWSCVCEGNAK